MATKKTTSQTGARTASRTATRTATSTEAYTQGNVTVTGGAGDGDTTVTIPGRGKQNSKVKKNPSPGEIKHGPHASAEMRMAVAAALKKARAFFGNDDLVEEPQALKSYTMPVAFVELGTLVALEYDSHKFDGESRIYRHEATKKRRMLMSVDGSTIIIHPRLKLTKRGIEG